MICATAACESGARPRLVCRTTPVALMTRRRHGARAVSTFSTTPTTTSAMISATTRASSWASSNASGFGTADCDGSFFRRARKSARTRRTVWVTRARPDFSARATRRGWRRSSSTEGMARRRAPESFCNLAADSGTGFIAKAFEHNVIRAGNRRLAGRHFPLRHIGGGSH